MSENTKKTITHPDYKVAQDYVYDESTEDWWDWSLWIEATPEKLDKIEYVVYTLHETFPSPVRKVTNRQDNFKISSAGWGVFNIYVKIHLKDNTDISLEHYLYLAYPDGKANYE